jgi:hypothetical protein
VGGIGSTLGDTATQAPNSVAGAANSTLGNAGSATTADLSALEARSGKQIELTGYSFEDNNPPGSPKISCPQIHQEAGGTGTFADPITVANDGAGGSGGTSGFECGKRFYLPSVQRYVIVEDTGNTPGDIPHLDMYVDHDPSKTCMDKITAKVIAIPNPPQGLPVLAGPIGRGGSCLLPGGGASGDQPSDTGRTAGHGPDSASAVKASSSKAPSGGSSSSKDDD